MSGRPVAGRSRGRAVNSQSARCSAQKARCSSSATAARSSATNAPEPGGGRFGEHDLGCPGSVDAPQIAVEQLGDQRALAPAVEDRVVLRDPQLEGAVGQPLRMEPDQRGLLPGERGLLLGGERSSRAVRRPASSRWRRSSKETGAVTRRCTSWSGSHRNPRGGRRPAGSGGRPSSSPGRCARRPLTRRPGCGIRRRCGRSARPRPARCGRACRPATGRGGRRPRRRRAARPGPRRSAATAAGTGCPRCRGRRGRCAGPGPGWSGTEGGPGAGSPALPPGPG